MTERMDSHLTDTQLNDCAEGALDLATRAITDQHLASCTRCRTAVDETRAVMSWARNERSRAKAPAELWTLISSSTIHLAAVRRQVMASMRGVLIAGALAIVVATAVITWRVARWTSRPQVVVPPAGAPAPGTHAPGGRHPTTEAPRPPSAPLAPRP